MRPITKPERYGTITETFNILLKRQNFAKSGHTDGDRTRETAPYSDIILSNDLASIMS